MKFLLLLVMVLLRAIKSERGVVTTSPLFSFGAKGTVGKAITYCTVRGITYVREHFSPANPQSAGQVNVRTAMTLLNAYWQTQSVAGKLRWTTFASGTKNTGFSVFIKRGMLAYVAQLTTAVLPTSVTDDKVGPPGEVWTWA